MLFRQFLLGKRSNWVATIGIAALSSSSAFAETSVANPDHKTLSDAASSPWRIFGGFSAGLGNVSSGNDYQSAPSGGLVGLDLLGSYQLPKWVFDAGIGWMYSNINGRDSSGQEIRIRTRSATAELSPRYRLGRSWQVGPALQMLFGADTGFGPVVGNSIGTLYAGARLVYEISSMGTTGLPLRFLAQGLTDLNVSGRQVSLITAGVQIGIPIRASRSADVQARSTGTDVLSVSHSAPIRLVLDPQVVFFGTNSSKLREPILESLGQIGDYLSSNPGQWGRVEVTGHADRRGSYQYNLKLSKKRAESVKTALVSGDSLGERVRVEGYSYSKPEDPGNNPAAWAKNRRVEVVFYDVRDPEPLLKLIRELPLEKTAQGELK